MTPQNLIFDVGVCNGDDSAYYLHKGFRVVGIEANPLLIPRLKERFAREIEDGRYELVTVGIAEAEGEAQFWVSAHAEWSSFQRAIASRNGSRHTAMTVRTCRFRSILERFGTPLYCKIDIEGNDNLCLEDMRGAPRPRFVSVELIQDDRDQQIQLLKGLGYKSFKIISQLTLRQPGKTLTSLRAHLPHWLHRQFVRVESRVARRRFDGSWRFPRGSSGPFGEDTPGDWLTAEDAAELIDILVSARYPIDWHDIHASFEDAAEGATR